MKQTVWVFGANGKLGAHVVNQALDKGYNVKAFVRTPEKYALTKGQDIEVVKDDIRVDGKSVLDILTLGATQGTRVQLEATGADAQQAISALEELVVAGFPATADSGDTGSG